MPPKSARGRGASRARGGSRGGAAASRARNNGNDISSSTPVDADAAVSQESSAQSTKVDHDAKPSIPVEGDLAVAETQSSSLASSSTAPHDVTDSPSRPPVQRLGSLNTSRSASPAIRRGTSTRGKRGGTMMPPVSTRRSKEERASREKELLSREKERTREQADADRRRKREAENAARRRENQAQRSRGGMSGAMSGPFSLGYSRDDRKLSQRSTSTFGSGSGSRASRVKDEDEPSGSGGGGGGWGPRSSGGLAIKREDGGVESDEDEEIAEFPRKDIDTIEISSDENEAVASTRPQRSTLPVRIGRKEHQERTIGINTDSSAETAAKATDIAEGAKTNASASRKHSTNKGKGKGAMIDVGQGKKPFKGVWDDPEELASPVKTEQNSEDEAMADAEPLGISQEPTQAASRLADISQETERKSKGRIKGVAEPVLQTDEDRAEWERFQNNLSHIRAELGPDDSATPDNSGDVGMEGANPNTKKQTVRDNNVYLFQIPPLMPELLSPGIKKELTDDEPVVSAPASSSKGEVRIKVEEGFSDPRARASNAPRFASGLVGKVRVRRSGRTTLDWGGTSYELTPGNKASFLQEVVSIQVVPENKRVAHEDAGEATSFGRVKGKFVVVPDWNQMLG